ncbi:MAG: adenylyl-sulfate kinase [archaeon]
MAGSGWVVWITGLPGSGKSVVARALRKSLADRSVRSQILASDELRKYVTPHASYSEEERDVVYATLVFIARLLSENGVNIIIDSTGNLRRYREHCRKSVTRYAEVYLQCPLEVCIRRETKRRRRFHAANRIYEKARTGKSGTVPGMGAPYEPPVSPELVLDTAAKSPSENAREIVTKLSQFLAGK